MSSPDGLETADRTEILQNLLKAIYENSTAAVFFHTVIAQQAGLGATEEKALLILNGIGPMTAGDIAQYTGLTTSSVTSLIDRLEAKGFVRRVRDAGDRRKVIVEPVPEQFAGLAKLFASLQNVLIGLIEGYSDEQLVLIAQFLNRATEGAREVTMKLGRKLERENEEPEG